MTVRLKDVAKRAGVSSTTVSLVLNQGSNSRISEKTRERILQAVKELGYQPNKTTQSLTPNIPPTIGLVITDITNPFFTDLAGVIENVASRYGYNIILCNTGQSLKKETEYLEVLWRRKVDGLIIAPVDDKESNIHEFLKRDIPVVFVDRYIEGADTNAVVLDNIEGAYTATEYLLRLGHRRIGILSGLQSVKTGKDRLQGYLNALKAYNVPVDERLISDGMFSVDGGKSAIDRLLSLSPRPTAIFSTAGPMTVGALLEFKKRRIKVPEDISFISFDDNIWALLVEPPITVIAQPIPDIGKEAVQFVVQLIQGWGTDGNRKIVLKPQLIIRNSCIPVTAAP